MIFAHASFHASCGPSWTVASAHHMVMCRFGIMSMISCTRSQCSFFFFLAVAFVRGVCGHYCNRDVFWLAAEGNGHDSAVYPLDIADEVFKFHVY